MKLIGFSVKVPRENDSTQHLFFSNLILFLLIVSIQKTIFNETSFENLIPTKIVRSFRSVAENMISIEK